MKTIRLSEKQKKKIVALKRRKHHPLVHHVHRKHKLSYKTLLYMKEYGPKSHVYHVIIKESIKILILASILSSIGGIGLESLNSKLITILPLLIVLPALNHMIGSYGTIVSSKFTTYLYLNKGRKKWDSKYIHKLFFTILIISIFSAIYIGTLASAISFIKGFSVSLSLLIKVLEITLISTVLLVVIIFTLSTTLGLYFYRKQEDPNNFLIPITTSVADLGSMLIFFGLVVLLF